MNITYYFRLVDRIFQDILPQNSILGRLVHKMWHFVRFITQHFIVECLYLRYKNKKNILFVVHNETMSMHIMPVYELLKKDKRLRLWVNFPLKNRFFPGNLDKLVKKHGLNIVSSKLAQYYRWNLIIMADHAGSFFGEKCKKILINHGPTAGKKVEGDNYKYGKYSKANGNKIAYNKIFETSEYSRDVVGKYHPEFYPVVSAVGSLIADKIIKYRWQVDNITKDIGLDASRKTILIASTWGPNSFIQRQGDALLKILPEISRKYNIILTIHQNNYLQEYSAGRDWQNIIANIRLNNYYWIRGGEEPFKFLVCADAMLTDMTSLSLYYTLFEKPIILYDNPGTEYDHGALIPKLKRVSCVINDAGDLLNDIDKCFNDATHINGIKEVASAAFSCLGEADKFYKKEIYSCLSIKAP